MPSCRTIVYKGLVAGARLAAHCPGSRLVACDACLESLVEYLVNHGVDAVDVHDRGRVEELRAVGVHPALLPVEQ